MARRFGACLRPRVKEEWSWGPRIESHVGLPEWSLLFLLPVSLPLSLCVSLMNKWIKSLKKKKVCGKCTGGMGLRGSPEDRVSEPLADKTFGIINF